MTSDHLTRLVGCMTCIVVLAVLPASAQEATKPLDNWQDLRAAFVRCWIVPKGTEGSVIAFRFLFAPNGGLRGPPRVQGKVLKGNDEAKKRFEAAAYAMLDRCLPVTLTPGFKAVMGESLLLLSLMNEPRKPAPNLGPNMTIFAEEARRDGD